MTNEDIYLQKSTSLQHHWVRNPCTRCGRRGSDNRTVPGAHWCFQANIQFLENILQSLKESMMTVQHHHIPRFVGWASPPFSAFVGSPTDAAQWKKLVTSSSSAKQHLPPEQLSRVDIPNTTDLPGPQHSQLQEPLQGKQIRTCQELLSVVQALPDQQSWHFILSA